MPTPPETAAPAAAPASAMFATRPGATVEPFDLEGMEELVNPPAATEAAPAAEEPAEESEAEPAEQTEETPAAAEGNPTEEEMVALQKEREEAAKPKEEPAAEVKTEPVKPEATERDKDLALPEATAAHAHPKTRKLIEARNALVKAARDERDAVAAEKLALETQLEEARTAAKSVKLPKETEEEIKTLRERVRELDISRDPSFEVKYDKPIAKNNDLILETLKGFGLGKKIIDDKGTTADAPEQIQNLLKAGLSLKTLKPMIDQLEKDGEIDAAETLREAVRENARLTRGKQEEITNWKGDYDGRVAQRTAEQQQAQEQQIATIRSHAGDVLKNDIAELAKTVPYLLAPPAPIATDAPAVVAAKNKAIAEFNTLKAEVEKTTKTFNAAGLPPEEGVKAHGRLTAAAVKGTIITTHVLPRLMKDISAKDARIKELETQLGSLKKAGTLSRSHSAAAAAPANSPVSDPKAPLGDAFAAFAKSQGVTIDTNS